MSISSNMKKLSHFRLEPIRLRNNKEPTMIEFQLGMLSQMITLKKRAMTQLKKEEKENEQRLRISSKFLNQFMKPYEEETRYSKPNIQMLKRRDMVLQKHKSRNQEDSNEDQGSSFSTKTQTVSEYQSRQMKNNSYFRAPKRQYIASIVQNEIKPFILPISYKNTLTIEGIEEEKHCDSSRTQSKPLSNLNKNVLSNNIIDVIPEEKPISQISKEVITSRDRSSKGVSNEKDQTTSLASSMVKQERKLKLHLIKIINQDKKPAKVILTKRDSPPVYSNKISSFHSYTLIPLTASSSGPKMSLSKSFTMDQTYFYTINKSYRIQFESYFSHRTNWVMVNKQAKQINFQWKYFCKNVDYRKCLFDPIQPLKKQMMVNLFDNNSEIGNKKNLFLNLVKYCNKININVFELIPFTILLSNGRSFDQTIEALEELMSFLNTYTVTASPSSSGNDSGGIYFNKLYKDHFPNDNIISNHDKTQMFIGNSFLSPKNYWILKPVDLYKGMGIQLSNNLSEMKKLSKKILIGVDTSFKKETTTPMNGSINLIKSKDIEQSPQKDEELTSKKQKNVSHIYCSSQILIQKYLDNPLLYNKRKFDIRCYVLVDHNFNVYYCREGHLKGCSIEYDIETKSPFAHITNHSFQKHSENFQKYESGNEMSYQNFKDFLQLEGISLKLFDRMIAKMKNAIEISMNAVGSKLNKKEKMLSFEIFGYDFIIDNNFTPWILEINNNPGLGISSPVIEKLVPRMLDDAFRLTIDTFFETRYDASVINQETQKYKSRFSLDGYTDNENIFEFLCNIDRLS